VRKARTREGEQTLLAPVAGIVNKISATTLGEVADVGEPLVTLVLEGEELIVEGLVLNRDAGFVLKGQDVIVKLDAFFFTRRGYLKSVVSGCNRR
jgi:hemolysin D